MRYFALYLLTGVVFTAGLMIRSYWTDPPKTEDSWLQTCGAATVMVVSWPFWAYLVMRKARRR